MSEFSESFHLRSEVQADGERLLRRAGFGGAVFSAVRGWVTIVAACDLYEGVEAMAGANEGVLLHYFYAEDHCWQFAVYEGGRKICRYECDWVEDFGFDDSGVDKAVLVGLLRDKSLEGELESVLRPAGIEAIITDSPAYRFAELVGLEHYEWLGGGHLGEIEERDPEAIVVR